MTMALIFNFFNILVLILLSGCIFSLEHGSWAYSEVFKKTTLAVDKEKIRTLRDNVKRVKRIIYILYLVSLILFFITNHGNRKVLLTLIILMAICLLTPLRKLIVYLATKLILEQKRIKRYLTGRKETF